MVVFARPVWITLVLIVGLDPSPVDRAWGQTEDATSEALTTNPAVAEQPLEAIRQKRREFQLQELMLAKSGSWIFKLDETPRILWRDFETAQRLGFNQPLHMRWFDAELNESPEPNTSGRWLAWIEGTAPNGTPLRRARTFYALPNQLPSSFSPDLTVALPNFPGPDAPTVLKERKNEIVLLANNILPRAVLGSEQGAILVAGLSEAEPLGRPAKYIESTTVQNDQCHLELKLKLQRLEDKVRVLHPSRRREQPAIVLRDGSPVEAGVAPDAKAQIDALCQSWADDTGEPFVTLVARHGVIVTHEAFGTAPDGEPIGRHYRCWVASITKTVTAILFSLFLDQGLIDLDDSLAIVFPDYPTSDRHVPTFRQCFTHTSGLSGHGELGDIHTPHLENIVLNGVDVNKPGVKYSYCGLGYELVAKAMEIVAGQCAARLYDQHLFQPLGFRGARMGNASSGGEFTAMELGVMAQWMANRGSYGSRDFIRPETFERLLPQPLRVPDHGYTSEEGIGIHWQRHLKLDAPRDSKRDEDLLFGPHTFGHGSFSGCIFLVDPDQELIIVQVRKKTGPNHAEWNLRFLHTVAKVLGK